MRASQLYTFYPTPCPTMFKNRAVIFMRKGLFTNRLEPSCLDNAFPLRAPEVRKPTVNRYNYSKQDANFRCAVLKGWRQPFHVVLNLRALTCVRKGRGTARR